MDIDDDGADGGGDDNDCMCMYMAASHVKEFVCENYILFSMDIASL